jgi:cytochrome P450
VIEALEALGENPTPSAIAGCAALRGAIFEAMRLHPPVALWTRNVKSDKPAALGGYLLPAGTTVMIGNRHLHRDPAHWQNPDEYLPGRWTAELLASDPLGSAWFFPFGRGERTCFAQNVGLTFIALALAAALTRGNPMAGIGAPLHEDFWFGCMVPRNLQSSFSKPD